MLIDAGNLLGLQQFCAKTFNLMAQSLGEFNAGHLFGKPGHVIQLFRSGRLTAKCSALNDQCIDGLASRVQCGGQAGGAPSQYNQIVMASVGFGSQSKLCRQFGVCGLNQKGFIRKNDGGNYSFALVFFDDKLFSLRVFLDIDPIIWNLMLT